MDLNQRCFTIEKKGDQPSKQRRPCLANFRDQFVFLFNTEQQPIRYSLNENRWEKLPFTLIYESRACSLGDKLYVFDRAYSGSFSIKVLHSPGAPITSSELRWQVIEVPTDVFKQSQV